MTAAQVIEQLSKAKVATFSFFTKVDATLANQKRLCRQAL